MLEGNSVVLEILDVLFVKSHKEEVVRLVGNDQSEEKNTVTLSDILASVGYFINLHDNIGIIK